MFKWSEPYVQTQTLFKLQNRRILRRTNIIICICIIANFPFQILINTYSFADLNLHKRRSFAHLRIAAKHFKSPPIWGGFTKHIYSQCYIRTKHIYSQIYESRQDISNWYVFAKNCESLQNISNYHLASSCADTTNWRGSIHLPIVNNHNNHENRCWPILNHKRRKKSPNRANILWTLSGCTFWADNLSGWFSDEVCQMKPLTEAQLLGSLGSGVCQKRLLQYFEW